MKVKRELLKNMETKKDKEHFQKEDSKARDEKRANLS